MSGGPWASALNRGGWVRWGARGLGGARLQAHREWGVWGGGIWARACARAARSGVWCRAWGGATVSWTAGSCATRYLENLCCEMFGEQKWGEDRRVLGRGGDRLSNSWVAEVLVRVAGAGRRFFGHTLVAALRSRSACIFRSRTPEEVFFTLCIRQIDRTNPQ